MLLSGSSGDDATVTPTELPAEPPALQRGAAQRWLLAQLAPAGQPPWERWRSIADLGAAYGNGGRGATETVRRAAKVLADQGVVEMTAGQQARPTARSDGETRAALFVRLPLGDEDRELEAAHRAELEAERQRQEREHLAARLEATTAQLRSLLAALVGRHASQKAWEASYTLGRSCEALAAFSAELRTPPAPPAKESTGPRRRVARRR